MNSTLDSDKLEKIKSKIRSLINLADDKAATPGEVEAAMNLANRLMRQYMLEIEDIDVAKKEFNCVSKNMYWLHKQAICRSMDGMICRVFNCEMLFNRYLKRNTIYGVELDVDTSIYMINLAHNALDNAFNKYKRSHEYFKQVSFGYSKSSLKNDFVKGFAIAVIYTCKKLLDENNKEEENDIKTENKNCNALIVLKNQLVKETMEKENPNMKMSKGKIKFSANSSYQAGYVEGSKVTFNKGIVAND